MAKKDIRGAEKLLKATANRRRLAIIKYLFQVSEANVGNIAAEIKLSFTATSKHLGLLLVSGILEKEQVSLTMNYRLAQPLDPILKSIIATL